MGGSRGLNLGACIPTKETRSGSFWGRQSHECKNPRGDREGALVHLSRIFSDPALTRSSVNGIWHTRRGIRLRG